MGSAVKYWLLILTLLPLMAFTFTPREPDYIISVKVITVEGFGRNMYYTVIGHKNLITIDYFRVDSIYSKRMFADKDFPKNYLGDTTIEGSLIFLRKFDSLAKVHCRAEQKNITVKKRYQSAYTRQIDSLLHAPNATLLYRSSQYRDYMDGARYQFEIKEGKQLRKFEIANPDQYFAATPYRFLEETLRLLATNKK